jgi:hypothetical protein
MMKRWGIVLFALNFGFSQAIYALEGTWKWYFAVVPILFLLVCLPNWKKMDGRTTRNVAVGRAANDA